MSFTRNSLAVRGVAVRCGWSFVVTLLIVLALGRGSAAQEKIFEQEPFDIITLNEQNQNRVLKTLPLDLPDRKVPTSAPSGSLRIRLLNNPDEEFDLSWRGIAKIELFEQRVLREANRLTAASKFDDAFEHLGFLQNNYPKTEGLGVAVNALLFKEASAMYRQRNFERALLLLDELHQRNPGRRGLTTALTRVFEALFRGRVDVQDYRDARRIYGIVEARYGNELSGLLADWRNRLLSISQGVLKQARESLAEGDLRQAYMSSRSALEVWPETPGVRALMAETARRYPLVTMGVSQPYAPSTERPMFNWAHRRAGRLISRRLFELDGVGPDGSQYICPAGKAQVAEDGRSFSISFIQVEQPTQAFLGMSVSRQLLDLATAGHPPYDSAWARWFGEVSLAGAAELFCSLRRPHLRVQALLNIPIAGDRDRASQRIWQPYDEPIPIRTANESRFMLNTEYALAGRSQPREVVERSFDNPQQAVRALRRGDIDVLGRVYPADVTQLRRDASLTVQSYRIPSLHALISNPDRPHPANRIFRRGIAYALDRPTILNRDLLGGSKLPGCRLLSGPFPIGIGSDDPIAYANNSSLDPLPYDPRHARTLIQLAQLELDVAAEKTKQPKTSFTKLTLAHPPGEIARIACSEMVEDLQILGITCVLRVLAPNESRPSDGEWDFLYVDYQMGEPLVDARRLLAYDGFARCASPHLNLGLRQLDGVVSWNEAGSRLRAVHQLCYDDMSIIPLWQLNDFMAWRKQVNGVVDQPVATYQGIESWNLMPEE